MRTCPDCHAEYLDEPELCRSCGAPTISQDQAALWAALRDRIATERLVAVCALESPVDEAFLRRLLVDAGIPHAVHGGSVGGPLPGVDQGAVQGWGTLLVLEEHEEEARRVVRRYQESVVAEADASEPTA
ncbi:hypothetical protein L6R53_23660 [Myxococcota bacterium]|nr:hypothetical protein [Myxococcota bacterium]